MTPREERDRHQAAWDALDVSRAATPDLSPEDAAKADFIRDGGPDNLMAAYGAANGPVLADDPAPEEKPVAPLAIPPRVLAAVRGRRAPQAATTKPAAAAAPATVPTAPVAAPAAASVTPPAASASAAQSAPTGSGGDAASATDPAPTGLGYFSVLSRLNDQFAPHQAHQKVDYTNTNEIDAMDKAQRTAPDAALTTMLKRARLAKLLAPAAPRTNDALEVAKFNKQWELDHPKPVAPTKPGMTQDQVDQLFRARLASLNAQTSKANRADTGSSAENDAVEVGARLLLATGAMPSLGSGGSDLRAAILARAHQIDPDAASTIAKAAGTYGGEKHAVGQQIGRQASIETSTGALENTMDTVIANAEKVHGTGIPGVDRFVTPIAAGGGSVDAQNLLDSVKTAQAEYARLLSMGPNGNGQPFAENMKRAEQIIHPGMTPAQFRAAKEQMKALNAGINRAAANVGAEHAARLGVGDPRIISQRPPEAQTSAAAPAPTLKSAAKSAAVGSTFTFDGKTYRKVSDTEIEEG